MASTTGHIDKWLRGLDDLAVADPQVLEARLEALKTEAETIQLKIFVLEPLVARAKERYAREHPAPSDEGQTDTHELPGAPRDHEPADPAGEQPVRPVTWKSDAIIAYFTQNRGRLFTPAEVRAMLRETGLMVKEEGTPTALLLRRLASRGQIDQQGTRFGLPMEPADAPPPRFWPTGGSS